MQKRCIMIIIISIVLLCGVFLILTEPLIHLYGRTDITLNLNDEYKELGFQAKTRLKDMHKKVKITNNINSKKVGRYQVIYQLKSYFNQKTVVRNIHVIETKKPQIILKGKIDLELCPNEKYQEEGYDVVDNYDKNLKKKVKIKRQTNQIIYQVKDSSGNEDIKFRKITLKNENGPTLALKGKDVVVLKRNEKYQEEGYQATDICEGDITSKVLTLGHVDTTKPGTYSIRYVVKNKNGKEKEQIRTVFVTNQENSNGGVIYLTFDDGPSKEITPAILDILKKEKIKATFFVTDKPEELNPLIQREDTEGHTVALHTATHNYSYVYSSKEAYFEDLKTIQDKVNRLVGYKSKIIRFPGGGSNHVSMKYSEGIMTYLTQEVKQRGFYYYDWNIDSGDATRRYTSDEIYQNVISNLMPEKENIVLMHDFAGNNPTREALERIIQFGKQNGYVFAPITETTQEIHHKIAN